MISQTAEYTLRVIVFLAALRRQPATTKQIAAATRVPEGYLAKILQQLNRAKLIRSQRGLHGGSILLKDPDEISVFDVIDAVSPLPRTTECPLKLPSHGTNLCPLHRRLSDAEMLVEKAFRESTIGDLLTEPTESIPLGELATSPAAATRAAEITFPVQRTVKLGVPSKRKNKSSNGAR